MDDLQRVQMLSDRAEIIEAVNGYGISVDLQDLAWFRSLFADQVEVDYTSLLGGETHVVTADEFAHSWGALISEFDSSQHLITNHVVRLNGDEAESTVHQVAHHLLLNRRGGCTWTIAGCLVHRLRRTPDGWKIHYVRFTNLWGEGNFDLVLMAQRLMTQRSENVDDAGDV